MTFTAFAILVLHIDFYRFCDFGVDFSSAFFLVARCFGGLCAMLLVVHLCCTHIALYVVFSAMLLCK